MTDEWTQEQLQAHAFEKGLVVTARDELAEDIRTHYREVMGLSSRASLAESLLAAGWRKMPSREAILSAIDSSPWDEDQADAILALMDGDNE